MARLWRERASRRAGFRTGDGRHIRILYPGRQSSEAGPDFRDALIYGEGMGVVRGDVELHLRPEGWRQHGHGGDANYNGVVLHGALGGPGRPPTLANGSRPAVVSLEPLLEPGGPSAAGEARRQRAFLWALLSARGYAEPATRSAARELLTQAGIDRFLGKSRAMSSLMGEPGPREALYQSLMEGLGYSENRQAFQELAQLAPYASVEAAAAGTGREEGPAAAAGPGRGEGHAAEAGPNRGESPAALAIERLLMARSGMEPPDGVLIPPAGPSMGPKRWRLFRIRPSNHPRRRVRGAALLLARFIEPGLLPAMTALAAAGSWRELLRALTVSDPGGGPALIGRARASDLAVNAVLPLVHALSVRRDDAEVAQSVLEMYLAGPRPQSNRVTREMESTLFPAAWRPLADSLPSRQGLIHFHRLAQGEG